MRVNTKMYNLQLILLKYRSILSERMNWAYEYYTKEVL